MAKKLVGLASLQKEKNEAAESVNPFEGTEIIKKMGAAEGFNETVKDIEAGTLPNNPFEAAGVIEDLAGLPADDGSHKCDSCSLEYATCAATTVKFGIDVNPEATGAEADRVLSCSSYLMREPAAVVNVHNLDEVLESQIKEPADDDIPFLPAPYTANERDYVSSTFTRDLPVMVPEHELALHAQEMARLHSLWVKTKLDAKDFAKSCKEVTDRCEKKELELAEIINAGTELRPVACFWVADYNHNVKRLVRLDSNQVIEEQALTPDDRQLDLFQNSAQAIKDVAALVDGDAPEGDTGGDGVETSQESSEEVEDIDYVAEEMEEDRSSDSISHISAEGDVTEGKSSIVDLDKGWPL